MLERDDIDRLKDIFVMRQECDDTMSEVDKKLANDNKELALIKQSLGTISWVSKTTLAAVIAVIVGAILKLVVVG